MGKPNIGFVVGSASASSINRQLAQGLMKLIAPEANASLIEIAHLPLYNRDDDAAYPAVFQALKDQVKAQDGIVFVTPEQNRSVPALLKNALDAGSRPYGQGAWNGIPAAVIGTSPGAAATAMAQQHLRNILVFLDMPVMAQPEGFIRWSDGLIDAQGEIGEASRKFLQGYMSQFLAWVQVHRKA
ncbi:NADPH-dependent FMN reductase [Comamonas serinivorans]|uniref:NADPH-dependent FMN reductase n=1 Tax=Comamonas serinivorans TaxID=1082851 RepID=A0A1Y0EQP2_9BURK|nr:NADPH-dependent FMN reductase [Comamonas serinivorans]ARU05975.1 NADPH-dependent FMN reductase [Comamonas serinivorans]